MRSTPLVIVLVDVVSLLLLVVKKLCPVQMRSAGALAVLHQQDGFKRVIAVFLVDTFGIDAILSVGNYLRKMPTEKIL